MCARKQPFLYGSRTSDTCILCPFHSPSIFSFSPCPSIPSLLCRTRLDATSHTPCAVIRRLQYVLAHIRRQQQITNPLLYVLLRHLHLLPRPLRRIERYLLHYSLNHRMQPSRAYILHRSIRHESHPSDLADRQVFENQVHLFGFHQLYLLSDEVCDGLGEDSVHVFLSQTLERDSDGQSSLQLCQQVGGLGGVEGARRDKQDEVCVDVAVLGGDGGAFDQRQ
mmetsp:Transcript_26178/g.57962  ORF Transcript_26178/g.57962 Transcript_26178/m.57962 type:complete len:223 (-) Transcript_26178:88-756(-)